MQSIYNQKGPLLMADSCSAIIAAHNAKRFIAEAVESLLAQTRRPEQILVIDDGSTDGTAAALERFGDAIRILRQDRGGVGAARNRGIEAASGEMIAFLDADDVCEPQRIERQMEVLAGDTEAAMVFCAVKFIDEFSQAIGEPMRADQYSRAGFFGRMFVRNRIPTASAVMIRRAVAKELGGFDENLVQAEDYDLWLRVAAKYPVAYVDQPLAQFRIHENTLRRNRMELHAAVVRALSKHSLETMRDALEKAYDSYLEIEMALASILLRMDDLDNAERILRALQEKEFVDPAVHFYRGNIHLIRGEMDRAEAELRQAVLLDDAFACAYNNLGVVLAARERPEDARQAFEMARALRLEYSDPAVNLQILREGGSCKSMRITFNRLRATLRPEFGPMEETML